MKEAVYRVIEKEGPNGLIIKRAIYGKLTDCDLSRYALDFLIISVFLKY